MVPEALGLARSLSLPGSRSSSATGSCRRAAAASRPCRTRSSCSSSATARSTRAARSRSARCRTSRSPTPAPTAPASCASGSTYPRRRWRASTPAGRASSASRSSARSRCSTPTAPRTRSRRWTRCAGEITAAGGEPGEEAGVDAEALLQLGRPAGRARAPRRTGDRRDPERDSAFSRHRRLRRARALLALDRAAGGGRGAAAVRDRPARAGLRAALGPGGRRARGRRRAREQLAARRRDRAAARGRRSSAAAPGAACGWPRCTDAWRSRAARARPPRTRSRRAASWRSCCAIPHAAPSVLAPLQDALAGRRRRRRRRAAGLRRGADRGALPPRRTPTPEQVAERLAAGARRWPDELALAQEQAGALSAMGRDEAAQAVLSAFAEAHPDEPDAWSSAGIAAVGARRRRGGRARGLAARPLRRARVRGLGARPLGDRARREPHGAPPSWADAARLGRPALDVAARGVRDRRLGRGPRAASASCSPRPARRRPRACAGRG